MDEVIPRIGYSGRHDCYVNLAGDYDYLVSGYYDSLDLELEGKIVYPRCKEVLDAYVTPLLLEKAKLAEIPVPNYYITNGYFEPPVVVDAVNPFMSKQSVVLSQSAQERVGKSLTRNFKYMICCQELPERSSVGWFRSVMGWTTRSEYRPLAKEIWETFHIPVAKVRVIRTEYGAVLLSGLWPLKYEALNAHEIERVNSQIQWQT